MIAANGTDNIGKSPVQSRAAKFNKHDFNELLDPVGLDIYASYGSCTSRAYNTVLYHTRIDALTGETYAMGVHVWRNNARCTTPDAKTHCADASPMGSPATAKKGVPVSPNAFADNGVTSTAGKGVECSPTLPTAV